MPDPNLLAATCRVALAGLLHDLGKFAERARLDIPNREAQIAQYCPVHDGRPSHKHAAYTAAALERLRDDGLLPPLTGEPFGLTAADDTLENAAAMHHRPATKLQHIVAIADRLSSGFERQEGQDFAQPEDATTHYSCRLRTLFEQVRLPKEAQPARDGAAASRGFRYRLEALSPSSLLPVAAEGYELGGTREQSRRSQEEYAALWNQFRDALKSTAESKTSLPLWLDAFDSLLACYWHAIPSATPWAKASVNPDVPLYDHARATAAFAAALWRVHRDAAAVPGDSAHPEFLLVQGDLAGIQDFIFATGGETQKSAAKLLRGRSFYVSLLMECAALRILGETSMPPSAQIYNAAGKFLLVLPNETAVREILADLQAEFDRWSYDCSAAQLSLRIASMPAARADFTKAAFAALNHRLFAQLAAAKLRAFDLCSSAKQPPVMSEALAALRPHGACRACGRLPARDADGWCTLCQDHKLLGEELAKPRPGLAVARSGASLAGRQLASAPYGFAAALGEPRQLATAHGLVRLWDLAPPTSLAEALFRGFARRNINGYVPRFSPSDVDSQGKYQGCGEDGPVRDGEVKTFSHLAYENRTKDTAAWVGLPALGVLKGDVDNLGIIIQSGLPNQTFARLAGLSRQLNNFFAVYLPALCAEKFPDTYTVFAGGDDFFLIGPWGQILDLAAHMRESFACYVARNPDIHFSAGFCLAKPGLPVRALATGAESALERAKSAGKNRIACFAQVAPWEKFEHWRSQAERLDDLAEKHELSSGYVYNLLRFADMRESLRPIAGKSIPLDNAVWRALFCDRTHRFLAGRPAANRDAAAADLLPLAAEIDEQGASFRVPVSIHLYRHRRD